MPASGLSFLICEMWDYSALGSHPAPSLRVPRSRPGTRRTGAGCGPGARADAALDGRAQGGGQREERNLDLQQLQTGACDKLEAVLLTIGKSTPIFRAQTCRRLRGGILLPALAAPALPFSLFGVRRRRVQDRLIPFHLHHALGVQFQF